MGVFSILVNFKIFLVVERCDNSIVLIINNIQCYRNNVVTHCSGNRKETFDITFVFKNVCANQVVGLYVIKTFVISTNFNIHTG